MTMFIDSTVLVGSIPASVPLDRIKLASLVNQAEDEETINELVHSFLIDAGMSRQDISDLLNKCKLVGTGHITAGHDALSSASTVKDTSDVTPVSNIYVMHCSDVQFLS